MKSIIALTLLFVLTACSTKPIVNYTETVSLVDNNVTSDRSTIVVRRDMGFMGSGCPVEIYLNGVKYARLQSSQSINIHTTAGTHILSAKFTGRGFCQDRLNETEVTIQKNESKYYRLAMNANGDFHIFPTLSTPIQ
ncbi:hypothetical protein C0134_02950 [Moraxella catarrhalis]|uniref:hypothetical protein n=2 Tax=Moraxella catarrhalis TaxID=480 RepID=UPI000202AAA4|nr:hypothetical protein [Moraxella catarrhalis]EGE11741.1 hypothetical protein E9K_08864 [Moraxella catarrhalis 103P14B1]AIK01458.1 hypothetical protein DR90_921 [Moraxella catarrhalis]AXT96533.1 hypothetical protein SQ01_04455 [Moraxella catarrhalis]MCG6814125.1 hypothetical protein [Moraxella catarrhalis]MPW54559.1 hypothetical protein [Moraxella catarrhalis]